MNPALLQHASALAGLVVPFITQLIRDRVVRVSGLSAHILAVGVSVVAVAAAHLGLHQGLSLTGLVADIGVAYTLAATVYHALPVASAAGAPPVS